MAKFEAPDLSNMTPTGLLDEMGKLSVVENYVKKLRNYYKEAYLSQMEITAEGLLNGEVVTKEGEIFIASTSRSDPERVSTTLLKEKYPDIAAECTTSKPQLTTRFTLREGVNNPIVNDLLEQMKKELDLE